MGLEKIAGGNFRITGRSGFEDAVFTAGSPRSLTLPDAVAFAQKNEAVLWSTREVAALRVELGEQLGREDGADLDQLTRTVIVYFKDGQTWYAAVDDIADPERNIILAKAKEGYDTHSHWPKWAFLKSDKYICDTLDRAQKSARIFEVSERSPLELTTEQVAGRSAFGQHPGVKAVLGDLSEEYARFLVGKGIRVGRFSYVRSRGLEELNLGDNKVEIRFAQPCGYAFEDSGEILPWSKQYDVKAYACCTDKGRARGVRFLTAEQAR